MKMNEDLKRRNWDLIIIGGGIAGLTAAAFAARAGQQVLLVEKANQVGGRAATDEQEECLFNRGPHALFAKAGGMGVLRELGISPEGKLAVAKGELVYEQKRFAMPTAPGPILFSQLLSWSDKKELVRFMAGLSRIDTKAIMGVSLADWVNQQFHQEKIRLCFLMLCRLSSYSIDPQLASAGAIIEQLKVALGGALYVDGGWQSIVDSLRQKATAAGATICEQVRVTKVEAGKPLLTVALEPDVQLNTRAVIFAVPPATAEKLLNRTDTRFTLWKNQLIPVKGASLDIAVRRLPRPDVCFAMQLDEPYYFSNHSRSAKLARNPEHQVLHLFRYLSSKDEEAAGKIKGDLENFLSIIQPGWQKEVITSRFLPGLTVAHGLPLAANPDICIGDVAIPEIPGMYAAGDWLQSGGMLADASFTSGKAAAIASLKRL